MSPLAAFKLPTYQSTPKLLEKYNNDFRNKLSLHNHFGSFTNIMMSTPTTLDSSWTTIDPIWAKVILPDCSCRAELQCYFFQFSFFKLFKCNLHTAPWTVHVCNFANPLLKQPQLIKLEIWPL